MRTNFFKLLRHDSKGATAVEYGLVVGLIAIAMVTALWGVSETSTGMWNDIDTRSTAAMSN
ncbi:Flp family type IVb pilin [Erythrobacter sp. R86502]|uniref:Flp family type IVb pilin n=1 Tax=Erythrobacter sp. R86502 TaxID=3093846 RepID=UPI0036D3C486